MTREILLITIFMVLISLNTSVFETHAQNAQGGAGGNAGAWSSFNMYCSSPRSCPIVGSNATANGGRGGNIEHQSPPSASGGRGGSANSSLIAPRLDLTYVNPTYGVKMQYPSDWIMDETKRGDVFVKFFLTDSAGYHIAGVRLGNSSWGNSNLTDNMRNQINNYDPTYVPNFKYDSNTSSTLAGRPAYKFVFEGITPNGVALRGVQIGTTVGSNLYWIDYTMPSDYYYSKYSLTAQKMVDSFKLSASPIPLPTLVKYVNPKYGVMMLYPSDWTKNETNEDPLFATFHLPQGQHSFHQGGVYLGRVHIPSGYTHDLSDNMRILINILKHKQQLLHNYHIVDSNTSFTLAGQPAFIIIATYTFHGVNIKDVYISTVVGSNRYYIQANFPADQYSKYMPIVQQVINSYKLSGNSR